MILITGGTGYIGSHTVVELMQAGYEVLIVDNCCNSKATVLDRIERIVGHRPGFVEADVRDREAMRALFAEHRFEAVVHFAGLKAVGESVTQPLRYYDNNIHGSLVLFEAMAAAGVKTLVFSSSATVYGDPHTVPIREDFPLSATNPYGRSKLMIEQMLGVMAPLRLPPRQQYTSGRYDLGLPENQVSRCWAMLRVRTLRGALQYCVISIRWARMNPV